MKIMLFNWDLVDVDINDPSDLTNDEFCELADNFGFVYNSLSDFESDFNAEMFSAHTHQIRIVN